MNPYDTKIIAQVVGAARLRQFDHRHTSHFEAEGDGVRFAVTIQGGLVAGEDPSLIGWMENAHGHLVFAEIGIPAFGGAALGAWLRLTAGASWARNDEKEKTVECVNCHQPLTLEQGSPCVMRTEQGAFIAGRLCSRPECMLEYRVRCAQAGWREVYKQ